MPTDHRRELKKIRRFDQLIAYLRDEMGWPIARDSFDSVDDLFYDFTPEELGIDTKNAAKIQEIKRLRPLSTHQPWGIFFVKFEPKQLPVVALRRILSQVALKKRSSANSAERAAWSADDLLFVSNYGEGDSRQISFAHFSQNTEKKDLPTLKVLGWNNLDTALHLDDISEKLTKRLAWPDDEDDPQEWRARWRSAFTLEHREAINTSKKLSVELAALARNIRDRINTVLRIETEHGPVSKLMAAFKTSLIHDLDEDGFSDMYAQTIAYGLLSARVANPSADTADDVAAAMPVTNPFLKELMQTFLHVGGRRGKSEGGPGLDFDELGVSDVVELLDAANMEAVVRDFGDRNPQEDPVIHFYELFLTEYDARRRMQRGVFYTPRPVVSFIVRSVDERLRTEFGLEDGLADTTSWGEIADRFEGMAMPDGINSNQSFVQILDPAAGTGTFLVEVIGVIHKTMTDKWRAESHDACRIEQLWNEYVPEHLLNRLYGFELMMAPYAIAHMKVGLKLYETGYRFESEARARIFLTNTLEPAHDFSGTLAFAIPALAHETEAVNAIKRDQRFTVVIGNPPYSKSSQNQGLWISELMEEYKRTVRTEETQIQALSDDYSKFLRFGHFMIEQTGVGILGYITNNGFLDGPLFRDMRQSMLEFFGVISVHNLHGDSRKQFSPPDGMGDENVFDIQQGVAISIFERNRLPQAVGGVSYSEIWGDRQQRYDALQSRSTASYDFASLEPEAPYFLFVPVAKDLEAEFSVGWHLYEIFGTGNRQADNHESYGAGFVTQQDKFAIGFSDSDLENNVQAFLDPSIDDESLWKRFGFCSTNQWNFERAKQELKKDDIKSRTKRCLYRPFDYRYTVFDRNICTITRKRITYQFDLENIALLTTRRVTRLPYNNVFVTDHSAEYKVASHDRNTIVFPLWIYTNTSDASLSLVPGSRRLNLNPAFLRRLSESVCVPQKGEHGLPAQVTPECIFSYIYAVLHSPSYRSRYGEFLKIDFPRIPLPGSLDLFNALADLGRNLVSLHLLKSPKIQEHITTPIFDDMQQVEKVSYSDETVWLNTARTRGIKNVPKIVWDFHIGGYQVCNKWLKDRQAKGGKYPRDGISLTNEDIDHYQNIVVAIDETIRVMAEVDEIIDAHGGWPAAFYQDSIAAPADYPAIQQELLEAADNVAAYDKSAK